jgi:hypothetical protein
MAHSPVWKTLERFVEIHSPWLTLIGEKLQDERGHVCDYWRVEKADSAIILPIWQQQLLLPVPTYRPGVGQVTLDFPGGRIPTGQEPAAVVPAILSRELGIPEAESAIAYLTPLNPTGWLINSSFSNQKLYGFVATLLPTASFNPERLGNTYATTPEGIDALLQALSCLQCRALLLEWWRMQTFVKKHKRTKDTEFFY